MERVIYIICVGSKSIPRCPYVREAERSLHREGGSEVMEAETGVIGHQVKGYPQLPGTGMDSHLQRLEETAL